MGLAIIEAWLIYRVMKCQRIDKSLPKHLVIVFAYMSGRLGKGYKRNHVSAAGINRWRSHASRIPADQSLRDQLTEDLIKTNDEHDWSGIVNCAGCPVWRRGIFERPRYVPFFLTSLKLGCRLFQLNFNSSAPRGPRHLLQRGVSLMPKRTAYMKVWIYLQLNKLFKC